MNTEVLSDRCLHSSLNTRRLNIVYVGMMYKVLEVAKKCLLHDLNWEMEATLGLDRQLRDFPVETSGPSIADAMTRALL